MNGGGNRRNRWVTDANNDLDTKQNNVESAFDDVLAADGGQRGGGQAPGSSPAEVVDAMKEFVYAANEDLNLDDDGVRAMLNKLNEDAVAVAFANSGMSSDEVLDLTEGIGEISNRTLQNEIEYTGQYRQDGNGGNGGNEQQEQQEPVQGQQEPEQQENSEEAVPDGAGQYQLPRDMAAAVESLDEPYRDVVMTVTDDDQSLLPETAYVAAVLAGDDAALEDVSYDELEALVESFYQQDEWYTNEDAEAAAESVAQELYDALQQEQELTADGAGTYEDAAVEETDLPAAYDPDGENGWADVYAFAGDAPRDEAEYLVSLTDPDAVTSEDHLKGLLNAHYDEKQDSFVEQRANELWGAMANAGYTEA